MKTYLECVPCLIRHALDASRMVTNDETIHEKTVREVVIALGKFDFSRTSPEMAQFIHRLIRKYTDSADPYKKHKDRYNKLVLNDYHKFSKKIKSSDKPVQLALKFAIAGNIIDFAANSNLENFSLEDAIKEALSTPIHGNFDEFYNTVVKAENILYLTDNAGEIVFDRLLIEQLPKEKITVAVRGAPSINDATFEDAQDVGLTDIVKVIDNGSDAPGTILEDCSEAFKKKFEESDLIIAKGQGNFETLNEVEKDIYFILKVKCAVISRELDLAIGTPVLRRNSLID